MTENRIWQESLGEGPVIAVALHAGHFLRPQLLPFIALSDEVRLREEDPYTAQWSEIGNTQIVVVRSRFEVDLNRPREKAVYKFPEDAWGLNVFNPPLPDSVLEESLEEYDAFYNRMKDIFDGLASRYPAFAVLDLHSYNHRRDGPDAAPAPVEYNPEINVGTGTMLNRECFSHVIDSFIRNLRKFDFAGRSLDVRENIRFRGGHFPAWLHRRYPGKACVLSVEVKKVFMDEWCGHLDEDVHQMIHTALGTAIPELRQQMDNPRYILAP
jgi:hypothetical protein